MGLDLRGLNIEVDYSADMLTFYDLSGRIVAYGYIGEDGFVDIQFSTEPLS